MNESLVHDHWLSERLGCKSYYLQTFQSEQDLIEILNNLKRTNEDIFISSKVKCSDSSNIKILQEKDFHIVDTNLTFSKKLSSTELPDPINVRYANEKDQEGIEDIAAKSFKFTRFHLDKNIDNNTASDIKRLWVRNYFLGTRGDKMIVAYDGDTITGFVLVILTNNSFIIDLIAVSNNYLRRGIAQDMIQFCLNEFKGLEFGIVGTQAANIPSINLYEKLGYRLSESKYVFHKFIAKENI